MEKKEVYKGSLTTAGQKQEWDLYHQSNEVNRECAASIDQAISDSNYKLYHYDTKAAAKAVIDEYGADRVEWVLASILQSNDYDGRFSQEHKAWAKEFAIPDDQHYYCNTHSTILNGFIGNARDGIVAARESEKTEAGILYDHAARFTEFYKEFDLYGYRNAMEIGETDEDVIRSTYKDFQADQNQYDAAIEELDFALEEGLEGNLQAEAQQLLGDMTLHRLHLQNRAKQDDPIMKSSDELLKQSDTPDVMVGGYKIMASTAFDNDRGFSFGVNPKEIEPFGTWQFTSENGKQDHYWGHYFKELPRALQNYTGRIKEYQRDNPSRGAFYLKNAELTIEAQKGNYNMIDGIINNEPRDKADLTDGQTHEEMEELAPESLPESKMSISDRIKDFQPDPPDPSAPTTVSRNDPCK